MSINRADREEFENDIYKVEPISPNDKLQKHIDDGMFIKMGEHFRDIYEKPLVEPEDRTTATRVRESLTNGVEMIQADRQNDYGDALVSHQSIANFWNEYLERKMSCGTFVGLDATDVAVMLSLMKISRLAYKRKHDSVLDFASYANFALQFEENKE